MRPELDENSSAWTAHRNRLANSAAWLFVQFAVQFVVGLVLFLAYDRSVEGAYRSVSAMNPALRAFHYWGSALLIVHAVLHVLAMLALGGASRRNQIRFWASTAFAGCALGFQLTGNLLPWDRHGVQTAVIELGIAGRTPIVGGLLSRVMRGGPEFGQATLSLWSNLHFFGFTLIAIAAGAFAMRSHQQLKDAQHDARWLALPVVVTVALCFLGLPVSSAATAEDFGAFDARSGWYVLPLHGLLGIGDAALAVLLPGVVFVLLVLIPLVEHRLRRWTPLLSVGLLVGILGFGWIGRPAAPLVGKRDPESQEVPAPKRTGEVATVTTPIDPALVEKGGKLFESEGCADCHGKGGKGDAGGPSLFKTRERHPEPDFYIRYIRNPKSVKKSSTMPAYDALKIDQLRALADYLRSERAEPAIDKTKSPG